MDSNSHSDYYNMDNIIDSGRCYLRYSELKHCSLIHIVCVRISRLLNLF